MSRLEFIRKMIIENKKQHAIVVQDFSKPPVYEEADIPSPKNHQVQVKMIASTINPSDRIMLEGKYWKTKPGFVAGMEGVGVVTKAGDKEGQKLVGKKVTILSENGTWAEYTVADLSSVWEIQNNVPLESASSGCVNPLTVIGFVDTFRKRQNRDKTGKGLINTAAASSLGRMLNRYCQREKVPLLNIVRRKDQVQTLQQQGAKFIINTSDENWLQQYKQAIEVNGFNVLFDAIGGGEVSDQLISNLPPTRGVFIYGKLNADPLTISKPMIFTSRTMIGGWLMADWIGTLTKEQREAIQKDYSSLLKKQLATKSIKKIRLSEVYQNLQESAKRSSQGKFIVMIKETYKQQ